MAGNSKMQNILEVIGSSGKWLEAVGRSWMILHNSGDSG